MNITKSLPPEQNKNCFISLDSEWLGMNEKQLHRPNSGQFGCLTICIGEDVYYIDNPQDVPKALEIMNDCVWGIHNAKFDLVQLRRLADIPPRKKLLDSMLIERIAFGGYYDTFGLEDIVRRYLSIELDKSWQKAFATATEMTEQMIEYACLDSYYTLKAINEQKKQIDKDDFKIWTEIDRPALWAVMDFRGFAIDVDKWLALAELNKQRQEQVDAELPFNPRSHVQVKKWFAEHEIKLESSDEEHLTEVVNKKEGLIKEIAQQVLLSRMYGKRVSTYGQSLIDDYLEYDNGVPVIVSDFHITGAETGRMSSSSPNMQNIPARDTKEYRDCFIARPGNKLIIADYSAQEPRVTAYLSQDERLKQIFIEDKDIYCDMAEHIFNEKITKKDPRRQQMKSLILGMTYGLSKYGMSKRENISVEQAEQYLTQGFKLFHSVRRWMDSQQKKHKYVTTATGRKAWLNSYSDQSNRNALNSPIQGTAAEMMKKAFTTLYQEWMFDCPYGVVGVIHDEIVLDVPEPLSKNISKLLSDIMIQVGEEMCPGIPFKADVVIADRWSQK